MSVQRSLPLLTKTSWRTYKREETWCNSTSGHYYSITADLPRAGERTSNNTVWRAGTAIHLHHTAASHGITLSRQKRMIPNRGWKCASVWEGRNTRTNFLNIREVWEWRWNLKWAFPASHTKGTSHCIEHHHRHPLVLWQLLLNLTTKQKLWRINSTRTPRHRNVSIVENAH